MEVVAEARYLTRLKLRHKIFDKFVKGSNREHNMRTAQRLDTSHKLPVYTFIPMLLVSVTMCILALIDAMVCIVFIIISQVSMNTRVTQNLTLTFDDLAYQTNWPPRGQTCQKNFAKIEKFHTLWGCLGPPEGQLVWWAAPSGGSVKFWDTLINTRECLMDTTTGKIMFLGLQMVALNMRALSGHFSTWNLCIWFSNK